MNRDKMLEILHGVKLGAELTALTTEEALACTYFTSKGVSCQWLSLHDCDWPYCAVEIDCEILLKIKEKLKQRTLTREDLEKTELKKLYPSEKGDSPDSIILFFADIDNISLCDYERLYIFIGENVACFFETYNSFEKHFEEHLVSSINLWEDMSDHVLAEWVEKVIHEELIFPLSPDYPMKEDEE